MTYNQYPAQLFFQIRCYFLATLFFGVTSPVFSQTEEKSEPAEIQNDTTPIEDQMSPEKLNLRMSLDAFRINEEIKLQVKTRLKVKGKFQDIPGVEVSFYKGEVAPENFLGKDTSDHHGEAFWLIPVTQKPDSSGVATFWAVIQNDPKYEDAEETVDVNSSVMEMNVEEVDSVRLVNIFLGVPDETGQIVPIAEAECQLYVERLFGLLPIGEPETTDEEGRISIEFPSDIKGDESGNLTIVAKFTEHEIVGNVEASKMIAWGMPIVKEDFYARRELWSDISNPPMLLLIIVNTILLAVFIVIGYIFLEIIRINRLGRTN